MQVNEERSLGELLSDLRGQLRGLIKEEIELAKTEMAGKFSRAVIYLVFLIAGGLLACAGSLALMAAVILGIATGLKAWLAALITGLAVSLAGLSILGIGISQLKKINLKPTETLNTLREELRMDKEEVRWIKEKI